MTSYDFQGPGAFTVQYYSGLIEVVHGSAVFVMCDMCGHYAQGLYLAACGMGGRVLTDRVLGQGNR